MTSGYRPRPPKTVRAPWFQRTVDTGRPLWQLPHAFFVEHYGSPGRTETFVEWYQYAESRRQAAIDPSAIKSMGTVRCRHMKGLGPFGSWIDGRKKR